jgi:hypothetical protein
MTEPTKEELAKWNAELDATATETHLAGPMRIRIVEAQYDLHLIGKELVVHGIIRCYGARPGNRKQGWWNIKAPDVDWWPSVHFELLDWPARRAWHRCTDKSHCNGVGEMWHGPGCSHYEDGNHAVAERYPCGCGLTYQQAQERGFIPGEQRRDERLCNTCWNAAALAPGQTCPTCSKGATKEPQSIAATDRVRVVGAHLKHDGEVGSVLYASPVADRFEVAIGGAVLEFARAELEYVGPALAKGPDRYDNSAALKQKLMERGAFVTDKTLDEMVSFAMCWENTSASRDPETPFLRLRNGLEGERSNPKHEARERRRWERLTGPCHPVTGRPARRG